MRRISYAVGLAATALLIAGGCSGPKPPAGSGAEKGAELYHELGCARCHRTGGTGGLTEGVTSRRTYAWFESYLRNPLTVRDNSMMPAFNLSSEKSRLLWEYLRFLDGASGPEIVPPPIPFEKKSTE